MQGRFALLALAAVAPKADGHGAMVTPPSRNAADRHLPAFSTGTHNVQVYNCNCGNTSGTGCDPTGTRTNMTGQPCLWFSQGCTIGCDQCDNATQHTAGKSMCGSNGIAPTLPKSLWTMNRYADEDPEADVFRFHPWRAPGFAPVVDVCGMAGGAPHPSTGAAVFTNTNLSRQGDLGSVVLKPAPSKTVWAAGSTVEVAWGIRANHGGGYQYRICPASEPLTEACMQRRPLEFATGFSKLRYLNGTELPPFAAVDVREGTNPRGSVWRMNPIPPIVVPSWSHTPTALCNETRGAFPLSLGCRQFTPIACAEEGGNPPWAPIPGYGRAGPEDMGRCSGNLISATVVDRVVVPADLAPGDYVVGWRWDAEETAQVWLNCGDVSITAAV